MAKVLTSPIKRFSGTVALYDPLNIAQVIAFERAVDKARAARDEPDVTFMGLYAQWLPGILACVESWSLEGIPEKPTAETFPATPRMAVAILIQWLIKEISEVINPAEEDDDHPNG